MTEETPRSTTSTSTWLDLVPVAPRLLSAQERREWGWLHEGLAASPTSAVQERIKALSDLVMDRAQDLALEGLVALPPNHSLQAIDLPPRITRHIQNLQGGVWQDMSRMSIRDVSALAHVGIGSVRDLLHAVLVSAIDAATADPADLTDMPIHGPQIGSEVDLFFAPAQTDQHPPVVGLLGDAPDSALLAFAEWAHLVGQPEMTLREFLTAASLPDDIQDAARRLGAATADASAFLLPDAAAVVDEIVEEMDERQRVILTQRLIAEAPLTLEELGSEFGVTRERARQIETKVKELLHEDRLRGFFDAIIGGLGTLKPQQEVLEAFPSLGHRVTSMDAPLWQLATALPVDIEFNGAWCASPSLKAARAASQEMLEQVADAYGVVDLTDTPESPLLNPSWVVAQGWEIREQHVITRARSVNDWAAALLSIKGEPMTAEEIHGQLPTARSLPSLKNALGSDERFTRINLTGWALADWKMDTYTTIRDAIARTLDAHEGEILLEDLANSISARYGVATKSVITYAAAYPFTTERGKVHRAASAPTPRRKPAQTPRLYQRGSDWLLRLQLNSEQMRGSGWAIPAALAHAIGLAPGERVSLSGPAGEITCTWVGQQPALGSIRSAIMDAELNDGAHVLLVFGEDMDFSLEDVRGESLGPLAAALGMVGADVGLSGAVATATLAASVGLAPWTDMQKIIDLLEARGELDLAGRLGATVG